MIGRQVWIPILLSACGRKAPPPATAAEHNNQAGRAAGAYELPAAGARELVVRLVNPQGTLRLELSCGADTRLRAPLITDGASSLGVARFVDVPAERCTLYFKGGPPAEFTPVLAGSSLDCSLSATTALCREGKVGSAPSYP